MVQLATHRRNWLNGNFHEYFANVGSYACRHFFLRILSHIYIYIIYEIFFKRPKFLMSSENVHGSYKIIFNTNIDTYILQRAQKYLEPQKAIFNTLLYTEDYFSLNVCF